VLTAAAFRFGHPGHYQRPQRYAGQARKRGPEQARKAELDLRLAPIRYVFVQEVTLFQREIGHLPRVATAASPLEQALELTPAGRVGGTGRQVLNACL
jgi:hypothetical protein